LITVWHAAAIAGALQHHADRCLIAVDITFRGCLSEHAGQETNARRSASKAEEAPTQMSATQESNPRGKKGSKFAQIRAQEAARKAARTVASGVAQAAG